MKLGRIGTIAVVGGAALAAGAAVYYATGGAAKAATPGGAACQGTPLQAFQTLTLATGQQQSATYCAPAGGKILSSTPVSAQQAASQSPSVAGQIFQAAAGGAAPASQAQSSFVGSAITFSVLSGSTQGLGTYVVTYTDAAGNSNVAVVIINVTA